MSKNYKIIAEAIASGKLAEVDMPTENLDAKKLTIEELKAIVKEEFGKAKAVADVKAKESQFADADLADEVDWVKKLKLKEFFSK